MRVPHTPVRPTRAALGVAALLAVAAAAPAPASAANVVPTPLDTVAPVDVAARGTTVAWLRPTSAPRKNGTVLRSEAVVLDRPGATPRTLPAKLPDDAGRISVGTDGSKRVVLIVEGKGGAFVLRADGSGTPRKIAGQTSKDRAFTMRDGRIAFVRKSSDHSRVRTATAPGRKSTSLYTVPDEYTAVTLDLAAKGAVALQAYRPRDVGIGDIVWLLRPGKDVKRLTSQSTGGASENGIAGLVSSGNGRTFSVSRWNTGGGHPNDLQRFSSATAKRVASRKAVTIETAEAVQELALDGGATVVSPTQTLNCNSAGAPVVPDAPACQWLGLVAAR